jgi:hypothetical protein
MASGTGLEVNCELECLYITFQKRPGCAASRIPYDGLHATRIRTAAPDAAECTKGRFFDRANDKLSQLARFATNELVSLDLQAMASALADEVTSKLDGALPTDQSLTCPSHTRVW